MKARALGLAVAFLALFSAPATVAQVLAAGDVVTVCWNSDADDDFAVLTLAPIPAGTIFFLTDAGWSTSLNNLSPESLSPFWTRQIQFQASMAIPFGTFIEFDQAGGTAVLVNPALGTLTMVARNTPTTSTNNALSFGSVGDQLLVYQTAGNAVTGAATMISGFNGSASTVGGVFTITNGWQVGLIPQAGQDGATSESNAPGGLTVYDGTNAATATALGLASFPVGGLTGQDNYKYVGGTALGTKTAFLTAINNPANWSTNDVTPFSCNFPLVAAPEIAVSGNATNIVDGDVTPSLADHTDFGSVDTTSATLVRTFTIANTGTAALTVGAITVGGAQAADFSVSTPPASTVNAGANTTFQVTFNPSALGLRSASLSIANNDGDENPFDFAIQGTGVAPEIAVSGNAANIADGDVTPSLSDHTDFGSANVTGGSVVRTYTIANAGSANLTFGTVTVGGAQAADFTVSLQPNSPLAPSGTTTFQVTFDPSATGLRSATLSFGNNDADENPFDFAIQGNGASAEIQVFTGASTAPADERTDNVGTQVFADTNVSASSAAQTFTVKNVGSGDLTGLAVSKSGSNTGDFTLGALGATTLATNATTTFTATFAPTAGGSRSATLNIASNDADENPFRINVGGLGRSADIQVSKTNSESNLLAGRDTVYAILVTNAGPTLVNAVNIVDDVPNTVLLNAQWTCSSVPGALCPSASGSGDLNQTTGALPSGAVLRYDIVATPSGAPGTFVTNTATATNNDGSDSNNGNNSASDTDEIVAAGIFLDGFE